MPQDTLDIRTSPIAAQSAEVAHQSRRATSCRDLPSKNAWSPPVSVLRYTDRIEIIVDLAGVSREGVRLSITGRSLRIHGVRTCLEASCGDSAECRVLMMEIDDGPFERILNLPKALGDVSGQVRARQESGLLWITIPVCT